MQRNKCEAINVTIRHEKYFQKEKYLKTKNEKNKSN